MRHFVDKAITLGKSGSLHARRQVTAFVYDKAAVSRLFSEIAPRFQNVNGGYTRLIKTRLRRGDAAPMVIVELTKREESPIASPSGAVTPQLQAL